MKYENILTTMAQKYPEQNWTVYASTNSDKEASDNTSESALEFYNVRNIVFQQY